MRPLAERLGPRSGHKRATTKRESGALQWSAEASYGWQRVDELAGVEHARTYALLHRDAEVDPMKFERITINPNQMGGLPCIRGLRIPVTTVIGQLAAGRTHAEVLEDFPDLEEADIYAALEYAAAAVQERELPLVG